MRARLALLLLRMSKRLSPNVWASMVTAAASNISVTVTMAYLDRMGIDHCDRCAQTMGLSYHGYKAFCHQHKTESTDKFAVWLLK
jgi:hypothetical protein